MLFIFFLTAKVDVHYLRPQGVCIFYALLFFHHASIFMGNYAGHEERKWLSVLLGLPGYMFWRTENWFPGQILLC